MPGLRKRRYTDGYVRGWYRDASGTRRFFKGTQSADETRLLAHEYQAQADRERLGLTPLAAQAPHHLFLDVARDYLAYGRSAGGIGGHPWNAAHGRNRRTQLAWWDEQLQAATLAELTQRHRLMDQAIQRLSDSGKSPKTRAAYVETLKAFCAWCVERGYLTENPTQHLRRFDTTPETPRRVLTLPELDRLWRVVDAERLALYETALYSGLRAGELRALTVFHLDPQQSGLRLEARWTKNRKGGFQPLPHVLMHRLVRLSEMRRQQGAVRLLTIPTNLVRAFDRDCQRAGIAKVTHDGVLVFHSFRMTYATLLDLAGGSAKETQALLRHATPTLTMQRYVQSTRSAQHALLDRMVNYVQHGSPTDPVAVPQVVGGEPLQPLEQHDTLSIQPEGSRGFSLSSTPASSPQPSTSRLYFHTVPTTAPQQTDPPEGGVVTPVTRFMLPDAGSRTDPALRRLIHAWLARPALRARLLACLEEEDPS